MAGLWFLAAFFRIVPPVTSHIARLLWAAAAGAALAIATGIVAAPAALTPLLVLQIFAASTGFTAHARRGYYDVVLTRGVSRRTLLAAHWAASAGPGAGAWLAVAAIEAAVRGGRPSALAEGSLLAFALASTIPWAVTVPLPRFGAAMGWLVLLVTAMAVVPSGQAELIRAISDRRAAGLGAVALVAYPMGAIGLDVSALPWTTVAPGLALAAVSMSAAFLWCPRQDVPLEAAQ